MSVDPSDLGISSREDVERAITRLAGRIDELEAENERKDQRIDELESRLDGEVDALNNKIGRKFMGLADRVDDVESRLDDPTSSGARPDEDRALPIQQVRHTQKVDESMLSANERRAATIWGAFFEECTTTPSKHVLDSGTARTILRQAADERPHDETVRRVMELVADLGGGYVQLGKRNSRLTLVVDREEWEAFVAVLQRDDAGEGDG